MPEHKRYKNVTVTITMREFGIRTDIPEEEAILEALGKDLDSCALPESSIGFEEYFSDETISIKAL